MLLNFGMPKIPATTVQSNTPAFDPYAAVGFNPSSQYEGFMQQGNNNLYLKDGGLYESYTVTPRSFIKDMGPLGTQVWSSSHPGMYGMSSGPSYSSVFGFAGGWSPVGGPEAGTIYSGDQAFKPYKGETPFGFVKTGDEYNLSTAALSSLKPKYIPQANLGYNPTVSLLAPTAGGYGAGRYLGGDANMALNFSAPTGE
ncbi:hypothetical protein MTPG_00009 [Methylophilales phage HIM624-A]|nr:hypothetical protein MTPG_00009 [Methylophilales phage HIM624-A]